MGDDVLGALRRRGLDAKRRQGRGERCDRVAARVHERVDADVAQLGLVRRVPRLARISRPAPPRAVQRAERRERMGRIRRVTATQAHYLAHDLGAGLIELRDEQTRRVVGRCVLRAGPLHDVETTRREEVHREERAR